MKPITPELEAYFASNRELIYADAYTVELVGGTDDDYRLRWTTAQQDLVVDPLAGPPGKVTYLANVTGISGLRAKQSIGMEVDEQELVLTPSKDLAIQGVAAREAILWGALDGAFVRRDRFYFNAFGQPPVGGLPKFYGLVSTFDQIGRMDVQLKVKSGLVLLNQQMPRHLTQPTCLNRIYDSGCALDKDVLAVHGTVEAGATATFIPWAAGSGTGFGRGRVFFEAISDVGTWRAIKSADATGLTLAFPLPEVPATGAPFVAYPGCDGTAARCADLGNSARFRGFRFVPQSETAL